MINKINIKKIFDRSKKIDNIYGNYLSSIRYAKVKLQAWPKSETNLFEVLS
jgi:hypothetical protein